eukprot:5481745-Pyramimonas_sp.AAC.1
MGGAWERAALGSDAACPRACRGFPTMPWKPSASSCLGPKRAAGFDVHCSVARTWRWARAYGPPLGSAAFAEKPLVAKLSSGRRGKVGAITAARRAAAASGLSGSKGKPPSARA